MEALFTVLVLVFTILGFVQMLFGLAVVILTRDAHQRRHLLFFLGGIAVFLGLTYFTGWILVSIPMLMETFLLVGTSSLVIYGSLALLAPHRLS